MFANLTLARNKVLLAVPSRGQHLGTSNAVCGPETRVKSTIYVRGRKNPSPVFIAHSYWTVSEQGAVRT